MSDGLHAVSLRGMGRRLSQAWPPERARRGGRRVGRRASRERDANRSGIRRSGEPHVFLEVAVELLSLGSLTSVRMMSPHRWVEAIRLGEGEDLGCWFWIPARLFHLV